MDDENNIEKIYPDLKSIDYIHPIIEEKIYPTYISKPEIRDLNEQKFNPVRLILEKIE